MKETPIWENVYVGNFIDAKKFKGYKISVRGEDVDIEKDGTIPYSFVKTLYTGTDKEVQDLINKIADDIENKNKKGKTLVYCNAGIDRSPFIVACWLVLKKGFDPDIEYHIVADKRQIAYYHYDWWEILKNKGVFDNIKRIPQLPDFPDNMEIKIKKRKFL